MKKIIYIAPIYDGTGYAHMANQTIMALDKAGHKVTVRKQKLTGQVIPPPERVVQLERQFEPDCPDVIIQHTLPPHFVRTDGYGKHMKNIGYFHWETDNIMPSSWQFPISLMDEIWVSWEDNKTMLEKMMANNDLPRIPVRVVKGCILPTDATSVPSLGFSTLPYTFYHIGDCSVRKGTIELVTAYLKEFTAADNVQLVIKSYVDGKSTQDSLNHIADLVNKVKESLRDRVNGNWPKIHLISNYLSDQGIVALHKSCDCFVTLEKGAAWNIPAFDAWTAGRAVIAPDYGGQVAFLRGDGVTMLPTTEAPVYGMTTCGYPGVYTAYENWRAPSVIQASQIMRQYYRKGKQSYTRDLSAFTVEAVAAEMVEV